MDYSKQVAGNVRAEIVRAGLQKKSLETILGLSYQAIADRWNGEKEFSLSQIYKIAKALDIPVSRLTAEQKRLSAVPYAA